MRVRRVTIHTTGYLRLCIVVDGKVRHFYVHRLVAAAFIGECPPNHNVNHLDGEKRNPRPENLEYTTQSQNYRHALNTLGFRPARGEQHWKAARTEAQVREIKRRLAAGEGVVSVAREMDIPSSSVSLIGRGVTWAHVQL